MTARSWLVLLLLSCATPLCAAEFRAGAAAVDATPERFPVVVNCGFVEQTGKSALDKLHVRALVLDDGSARLAIVIVDSCMMPREFLDATKELVREETRIPIERQLIAATHTHTAPAVMGCLGSDMDPAYGEYLQRQIVRAVRLANDRLVPAKAGWAAGSTQGLTNNRQWVLRFDKVRKDPFGDLTVRSNMHPGYQHPDFVGPSGPVDPFLNMLAIRSLDDKPLAVLANFSMHYFGSAPVSADYFGRFCSILEKETGFPAMISQGTAGDLHWMDYGQPQTKTTLDEYAGKVASVARRNLANIRYQSDVSLAMAESILPLDRRVPDPARLAWARKRLAELGDRKPTSQPDIYAREAVLLHETPRRELKLQAIRIGELGITAIPNEVFALTGLKLKAASPLVPTFNVELANGAEGYIPPPEQYPLGGYTTWPARTAGLNAGAEPRITEAVILLLEKVSGKKQRPLPDPTTDSYAKAVLADRPVGYWRLGELSGDRAANLVLDRAGRYESGVVFGLEGPISPGFEGQAAVNRAAHFAGGLMQAPVPALGDRWSVEMWIWSGSAATERELPKTLFSLGHGNEMVLKLGKLAPDKPAVPMRTWAHVLSVRDGKVVRVYLNGQLQGERETPVAGAGEKLFVGGGPEPLQRFEGRIAEVAVHDRVLTDADGRLRVRLQRDREANR